MSKFHQLLNDNGDTAASADVQDKMVLTFESLKLKCRDKINQILEQSHSEVQPEDSVSNVGTALSRSSANALIQIDLELQREELHIEAKKAQMQAQMQAKQTEFELRDAKLRAEQRRQEIWLRAVLERAPGSATKVDFRVGSPTQARDPMWPPFLDVARRWTIRL